MSISIFEQRREVNKDKRSSYVDAFWDEEEQEFSEAFCKMITFAHATKIAMGNQLEDAVAHSVKASGNFTYHDKSSACKFDFDNPGDFYIKRFSFSRDELKRYDIDLKGKGKITVDGLIRRGNIIYIVELKDGSGFDTKKSQGEMESLLKCKKYMESRLGSSCIIKTKFVLWNCDDLKNSSVKTTTNRQSICLGETFCNTIGISKEVVNNNRKDLKKQNLRSAKRHLLKLMEVI